jgi:O-antigen/teichoic acid export membrane protein
MNDNIFGDILKYLPAQAVPMLVAFFSIPIFTRLFPPEGYGSYILVISTISVFISLIGWISIPIIRFFPSYKQDNRVEEFTVSVLKLMLISVLAASFVLLSGILVLKPYISMTFFLLFCLGIPVFILTACFGVLMEFLRARRKIGLYGGFMAWKSIASIGFGLLLVIVFGFGLSGLLLGSIISLFLAVPFVWKASVGNIHIRLQRLSSVLTAEMAKYGIPMVIGNFASLLLAVSDRYVIAAFRGSQEVGIYSASYAISDNSIMLIATLFALTSGSAVYNIWEKEGVAKSREFINQITRYQLVLCIPAVVGLSILAKPLISIFTGHQYQAGFRIVPFVASGAFFFGLQQRFIPGLNFFKKTQFLMLSTILAALINLFLNFLFVPAYGYFAAAITTLISSLFLLLLMVFFSKRYFVWPFPFKTLLKVVAASLIMGAAVYYLDCCLPEALALSLFLEVFAGIMVYCFLLFLFREIDLSRAFNSFKQALSSW